MKTLERALLFLAVLFAGCGTTRHVAVSSYHVTRDVAVGSYRVATAPVHYAMRGHSNEPTMVGTTDAIESDVAEPGHPAASTQVVSAPQGRPDTGTGTTQKPVGTSPRVAQTKKWAKAIAAVASVLRLDGVPNRRSGARQARIRVQSI